MAAALAALTAVGCASGHPVSSRDLGVIPARCDPVEFVVSLNGDDDDDDGTTDHDQTPISPTAEDNLRTIRFDHPDAARVFIAEPVRVDDGSPAPVRAYQTDRSTAFDFTATHAVPVDLLLEGLETSGGRRDLGFEYQYFRADDSTLCGPGALGTVVEPEITVARVDPDDPKLLAHGSTTLEVSWEPAVDERTTAWGFDGSGTFRTPDRRRSRFEAGTTFTPAGDRDRELARNEVTFDLAATPRIEMATPLNVTAPRSVTTTQTAPLVGTSALSTRQIGNVQRARDAEYRLFRWRVDYVIRDQFGDSITDSYRGGAHITIREVVPLTSPVTTGIDDLDAWIQAQIPRNTSVDWRNADDGEINDRLELGPPVSTVVELVQGRIRFVPRAAGANVATMRGHEWFVSVDEDAALERAVTSNDLDVVVVSLTPDPPGERLELRSTYTVRIR
jgi:hypothetical protein